MTLYKPGPGLADPVAFSSTMEALDQAAIAVLGTGVISGLTVDGTGNLQPGEALIGHLVGLAAAVSVPAHPQAVAGQTNFIFLAAGAAPPAATGVDAGQVLVNQTGVFPAKAVLLASVVLGAGSPPAVTSVSNAPAGRVQLSLPVSLSNRWRGAYDPAAAYRPSDEVGYGGSAYICVAACTGVTPGTDGAHWNVLALAGAPGATGPSTYNFRGAYDGAAGYAVNDVVAFNGSTYVATAPPAGHPPPNATYWALLAQAGAQGIQGLQGIQGAAGVAAYTFRGIYSSGTVYAVNDVVTSAGSSYVCLVAGSAYSLADATKWAALALAGAQGIQGTQGLQGIQGLQGNAGPAGLHWRGAYDPAAAYAANDGVSSGGSSYICLAATTGNAPPNATYWGLLAQAGSGGGGAAWTRITLALPAPLSVYGGSTYTLLADFSGQGVFGDEDCLTRLKCDTAGCVIERDENLCEAGRQGWLLYVPGAYGGAATTVTLTEGSVKNVSWTGAVTALVPTTWTLALVSGALPPV